MSREVEKIFCKCCESDYKILYEQDDTSGRAKFCPFCGDEVYDQDASTNDSSDDE